MKLFLSRTIRTALQNLYRNKTLSVAIFAVMTIALFVFQLTIATNLITDTAISLVHQQIDLAVELKPGVQDFQIQKTITDLKSLDSVRDAFYTPKEVALENFRQNHAEIAGFLDEYGIENPLPNTIFILTDSPAHHTIILNFLEQPVYKTIVDTSSAAAKIQTRTRTTRLIEITDAIRQFTVLFTGMLLLLSIFTIWNTIKIAMHSRRTEYQIMSLVGASPSFMCAPYLWEGIFYGLGSAFLATTFFGLIVKIITPQVAIYLAHEPMLFTSRWIKIFPEAFTDLGDFFGSNQIIIFTLAAGIGIIIGAGSAWLATLGRQK